MSLFNKRGVNFGKTLGNPLGSIFDKGPGLVDKVDMLFKDVETEGKKQGYDRAAKEYGKVYREIEKDYKEAKALIEEQKKNYDIKADELIAKLEMLEEKKARLEKQVDQKTKEVSRKFNIPVGDVKASVMGGRSIFTDYPQIDLLGIIYSHKERKLRKAEQEGYMEARELYERKIEKLKSELRRLKENGDRDIKKLISMIDEIYEAIADEQMKIAELKILL